MNAHAKVSRSYPAAASFALLALLLPVTGCIGGGIDDSSNAGKLGDAVTGPGFGVDYAWARPTPASLTADGYGFVARYLSHDTTGKNLSATEADALIAAGLDVVVVWEAGASDALSGFNLGVSDATAAASQALACGQPATRPIYFAIDFEATASQQAVIDQYYEGVASVIGLSRTGAYAGYGAMNGLFNDGKITWGWQTYAWSSGQWDSRAQLRQIENDIGPGGAWDKDQSMVDDFGQWGPGGVAAAPQACTAGGVAGTCIDTGTCASMTGYVSTAGLCAGAASVECCTPGASAPPPPPPPVTCTAAGVAGTCIDTATCAAMPGYVSTAGDCAGAATIECCTLAAVAPPPPAPVTCTAAGVSGTCIDTSACAAMPGYVSSAGDCAGAADIECCTLAPAAPPPASCTAKGVSGTCIDTGACVAMPGYVSSAGDCAGAANIECCTPPPACSANGVEGVCIDTGTCAAMGSTSTPGFCAGAASIECCTP